MFIFNNLNYNPSHKKKKFTALEIPLLSTLFVNNKISSKTVELFFLNKFLYGLGNNQQIKNVLQKFYGLGQTRANIFTVQFSFFSETLMLKQLTSNHHRILENSFEKINFNFFDNLKLIRKKNINFFKNINCYKGLRHISFLPVRGQRTHSNGHVARFLSSGSFEFIPKRPSSKLKKLSKYSRRKKHLLDSSNLRYKRLLNKSHVEFQKNNKRLYKFLLRKNKLGIFGKLHKEKEKVAKLKAKKSKISSLHKYLYIFFFRNNNNYLGNIFKGPKKLILDRSLPLGSFKSKNLYSSLIYFSIFLGFHKSIFSWFQKKYKLYSLTHFLNFWKTEFLIQSVSRNLEVILNTANIFSLIFKQFLMNLQVLSDWCLKYASHFLYGFSTGRCGFKPFETKSFIAGDTTVRAGLWFIWRSFKKLTPVRLHLSGLNKKMKLYVNRLLSLTTLKFKSFFGIDDSTSLSFNGCHLLHLPRKRYRYHQYNLLKIVGNFKKQFYFFSFFKNLNHENRTKFGSTQPLPKLSMLP